VLGFAPTTSQLQDGREGDDHECAILDNSADTDSVATKAHCRQLWPTESNQGSGQTPSLDWSSDASNQKQRQTLKPGLHHAWCELTAAQGGAAAALGQQPWRRSGQTSHGNAPVVMVSANLSDASNLLSGCYSTSTAHTLLSSLLPEDVALLAGGGPPASREPAALGASALPDDTSLVQHAAPEAQQLSLPAETVLARSVAHYPLAGAGTGTWKKYDSHLDCVLVGGCVAARAICVRGLATSLLLGLRLWCVHR
jgi:hypothetical protein